MERINVPAQTQFDESLAYSRVVAIGGNAWVSATAPFDAENNIAGKGDAFLQTEQCLKNIVCALEIAKFSARDIVRTRIFVRSYDYKAEVMRAHREVFKAIKPACSFLCVAEFFDPEILVYIEADAFKAEADK